MVAVGEKSTLVGHRGSGTSKTIRIVGTACAFGMAACLLLERQVVSWCAVPLNMVKRASNQHTV